jgi:hypothetical protein
MAIDGVGTDEAEAGAGLAEDAGDGVGAATGTDALALGLGDLALANEVAERLAERVVLRCGDAELAREGLGLEGLVFVFGQGGEDACGEVVHGGPRNVSRSRRASAYTRSRR